MLGIGGCLFLSGCSNDVATEEKNGVLPILFSASISTSVNTETTNGVQTKAETTTFPNGGSIAILAANATQNEVNSDGWAASNLYMNHVSATTLGTETPYPVNVPTTYYWPFNPNEYLTFSAYSPAIHASLSMTDTDTKAKLTVEVGTSSTTFPDLLYSAPTDRWNKEKGQNADEAQKKVALNQFQHAMTRLVIRVIPVDDKGEEIIDYDNAASIKIKKLAIRTKVTKGELNFTTETPAIWSVTEATDHTLYTIIESTDGIILPYNSEKMEEAKQDKTEYYILPATTSIATAEKSNIALTITDGIIDYNYTPAINEFMPATLEMGKITTLTFKVRVMKVSTGDTDHIVLMGDVSPWIEKGNSDVTIE